MRTPIRNVVKFEDLREGDYISAERKSRDWTKGPDWRQGTIHTKVEEGIYLNTGKILFDNDGWTFVLLERKED
jgi:hypothetical protein